MLNKNPLLQRYVYLSRKAENMPEILDNHQVCISLLIVLDFFRLKGKNMSQINERIKISKH